MSYINQGTDWTKHHIAYLIEGNTDGRSLKALADELGRSSYAIECKIDALIEKGHTLYKYDQRGQVIKGATKMSQPTATNQVVINQCGQTPKPTLAYQLDQPFLQTKTYTFLIGRDIDTYSKQEIFEIIAKKEEESMCLMSVLHRPKVLLAEVNKIDDELVALINYLDNQTSKAKGDYS